MTVGRLGSINNSTLKLTRSTEAAHAELVNAHIVFIIHGATLEATKCGLLESVCLTPSRQSFPVLLPQEVIAACPCKALGRL